jgi:hypothetical protein
VTDPAVGDPEPKRVGLLSATFESWSISTLEK